MNNQRTIKRTSEAIECGTLAVLLHMLQSDTPVFLMPLTFTTPYGGHGHQHYLVHVTTRTSLQNPILYASFEAAQTLGSALVAPYRLYDQEAVTRAQQLQEEMYQCLRQLIEAHPHVREVVVPARLRLPDEWVWRVRSQEPRILYQSKHWVLAEERTQEKAELPW